MAPVAGIVDPEVVSKPRRTEKLLLMRSNKRSRTQRQIS
jgi:hypothetical protein